MTDLLGRAARRTTPLARTTAAPTGIGTALVVIRGLLTLLVVGIVTGIVVGQVLVQLVTLLLAHVDVSGPR